MLRQITLETLRRSVLLVALASMVLSDAKAQEQEPLSMVRLSFSSGWDALPAVVAIERGFFAEQSLIVSGLAISSALSVVRSIGVGSIDFAAVPQRTLLTMAAADLPIRVISMNGWGTKTDLIVPLDDTGSQSLNDLTGKTIAVGLGSEAHPVLIRLLNSAGMHPSEVTIKFLSAEDLTRSFENGAAAAIIETRHFTQALIDSGQARALLSHDSIIKTLGVIGAQALVTRTDLIENDADTVQKFVNAWVRALEHIQLDPEDAARLLVIFFHRQGVVVSQEQAMDWVSMTRYDRAVWTDADIADAEYNGWGLMAGEILTSSPELDAFVDNRFAQSAVSGPR